LKLRRLIDSGFFGEILSVRGEFGYWVYEGDWQSAQRPSWNYRSEDGGGIVADMVPHSNYVIEELFGRIEHVYAQATTHIPRRWDEQGVEYAATADDAAYGVFRREGAPVVQMNSGWPARVHRDARAATCACTATSWSSSRSTAPRAPPSWACTEPASSPARPPRSRCGTPTSRIRTTTAPTGSRFPTTHSSTTASRCSGRTSWPRTPRAASTPSTSSPARAACAWPRPGSPAPPRAAGSHSTR